MIRFINDVINRFKFKRSIKRHKKYPSAYSANHRNESYF